MRDIPYLFILRETQTSDLCETSVIFQPLQETQTSELCETFFICNPSKRHKRRNYARHFSFFILQETQTSEWCETFLIFPPLENWFWQNQTGGKNKKQKTQPLLAGTLSLPQPSKICTPLEQNPDFISPTHKNTLFFTHTLGEGTTEVSTETSLD